MVLSRLEVKSERVHQWNVLFFRPICQPICLPHFFFILSLAVGLTKPTA